MVEATLFPLIAALTAVAALMEEAVRMEAVATTMVAAAPTAAAPLMAPVLRTTPPRQLL